MNFIGQNIGKKRAEQKMRDAQKVPERVEMSGFGAARFGEGRPDFSQKSNLFRHKYRGKVLYVWEEWARFL